MKFAIAQMDIQFEAQSENLLVAEQWIASAAKANADCILLPEMSFTGFSMKVSLLHELGSNAFANMQQLSQEYDIAIGFGWVKRNANGLGENHYTILQKNGSVLTDYVKIHPFSYGQEHLFYQGGTSIVNAILYDIPISILICYDLRFPEVFRAAAKNTSLIIVPANWLSVRNAHWKVLLQARAIENQIYVLGVNCVGTQGIYHFFGGSCLINPEGKTILECNNKAGLYFTEIVNDTAQFRENFPTWKDARPELYRTFY